MFYVKLCLLVFLAVWQGIIASKSSCTEKDVCFNSREGVCGCVSDCPFSDLEKAMNGTENQYRLWTTFHHPREAFPHLLVVQYSTDNYSAYDTYLWTSNAIYFVIPPHIFGLLSLFLGVLDSDHTGCVNLTIPQHCACWLEGRFYQSEDNNATLNHLEVLTERLRAYSGVFSLPQSLYDYQFLSSAVQSSHIDSVFHDGRETLTFLSFMLGLPVLAVVAYLLIVLSLRKEIKEKLEDPKEHQNFAALISLGVTFAWFATALDIMAAWWYEHSIPSNELYYSYENERNDNLFRILVISIACECFVILTMDIVPLAKGGVLYCYTMWHALYSHYTEGAEPIRRRRAKEDFWTFMLPLIPLVWCLSSHFGFVVIAWTSFVRHSTAFTVFYTFAITILFIISRQTYTLIVNSFYTEDEVANRKKIAIWVIWVLRLEAVLLVGFFAYLMFGLWLLPVAEVVEDAPTYLYNSLQLIIVILAILVSYRLISFKQDNMDRIENLLREVLQQRGQN